MPSRALRSILATLLLGALGIGCGSPDAPTAPAARPAGRVQPAVSGTRQAVRLACRTDTTWTVTGAIGPQGGTLQGNGFRVDFPAGPVDSVRTFSLSLLAGGSVELDARADGLAHYTFAVPVTATLDLSRCGTLPDGLAAWYIDPATGALVEYMGGSLDPIQRKLSFQTPHFSGYTVAW